jgi:hypothetical protein
MSSPIEQIIAEELAAAQARISARVARFVATGLLEAPGSAPAAALEGPAPSAPMPRPVRRPAVPAPPPMNASEPRPIASVGGPSREPKRLRGAALADFRARVLAAVPPRGAVRVAEVMRAIGPAYSRDRVSHALRELAAGGALAMQGERSTATYRRA